MPNTHTHNRGYAEAALPQHIYKRFSTCVVLCLVVHRGVDKFVDKVVYVCVHTRLFASVRVSVFVASPHGLSTGCGMVAVASLF